LGYFFYTASLFHCQRLDFFVYIAQQLLDISEFHKTVLMILDFVAFFSLYYLCLVVYLF